MASGRSRRSSGRRSGSGGAILVLLAFALAAAAVYALLPLRPAEPAFVDIAPGSTALSIATQLEQAGVIRSRWAFVAARLVKRLVRNDRLKAGEYRFERSATVTQVYDRIARGDVFTIAVTLPEGLDRREIAARLEQAGLGTAQGFLDATVTEASRIRDLDPEAASLEGYLFPDTYRFSRHASEAQMADAMVRRFREEARRLALTARVHEIVTLASIIEKETAVAAERPLVASVLVNRLAKGMPLMTDPAVIYGLREQGQWRGAIYASDLSDPGHDTPYNTYRHAGLPPGPISNPGAASLAAALHPAATDYLYFVASGDNPQGHSLFAATLADHQKNVATYRKAIESRGAQ